MQSWHDCRNHKGHGVFASEMPYDEISPCIRYTTKPILVREITIIGSMTPTTVRSAEAGHWGKDIRSDLHVAIEPRDEGGIELGLESRVSSYYGEAILTQARRVLENLGLKNARISI